MSRVEDLVCNLQKVVKCFLVNISPELQTPHPEKPNMFHCLEDSQCWLELLRQITAIRSDCVVSCMVTFSYLRASPKREMDQ